MPGKAFRDGSLLSSPHSIRAHLAYVLLAGYTLLYLSWQAFEWSPDEQPVARLRPSVRPIMRAPGYLAIS
jgi:hypothetical protein